MTIVSAHPFRLAEPQIAGPLAVFPVLGPEPALAYRTYAHAFTLGALVHELDDPSVNEIVLENPTNLPVLLYPGEELTGAQQNRFVDQAVLVLPERAAPVPVSCVERGRWDGSRRTETFAPAPHAADPELRQLKSRGAEQGQMWQAVDVRLERHQAASASDALGDVYDAKRFELDELGMALLPVDGQVGAIAFVSGRPVAIDLVSRADAFAWLHPRLTRGYALGALGAPAGRDPDEDAAGDLLERALAAPARPAAHAHPERGIALDDPALTGSRLDHEGELVALAAFPVG